MNADEEAILDKNLLEVANFIHLGTLIPFLLKNGIFTEEAFEKEIGLGSATEQTRLMLLGVKKQGQYIYDRFIDCLVEAEMFEAAHILRPDIKVPQPKPKPAKSREKAGEDMLAARLKDLNISVKRAVERYPESRANTCYRMESTPRGFAVIFVNERFENKAELYRIGASKDKQILKELFTQLGYKTLLFDNTSKHEVLNVLLHFTQREEHASVDSCVVVFSSHGKEDCIMCYDSELIAIKDIKKMFDNVNCPTLSGKPKIFIIQACGGGNLNAEVSNSGKEDKVRSNVTPRTAATDMITAYSTTPSCLASRSEKGSLYIHLIAEIFTKHSWNTRLVDMLTEVNRRMNRFGADGGEKQTAEIVLQNWQKLLFFNPGL